MRGYPCTSSSNIERLSLAAISCFCQLKRQTFYAVGLYADTTIPTILAMHVAMHSRDPCKRTVTDKDCRCFSRLVTKLNGFGGEPAIGHQSSLLSPSGHSDLSQSILLLVVLVTRDEIALASSWDRTVMTRNIMTRPCRAERSGAARREEKTRARPRIFSYRLCIRSSASNCGFLLTSKHLLVLLFLLFLHDLSRARRAASIQEGTRGFRVFHVARPDVATCFRRGRWT